LNNKVYLKKIDAKAQNGIFLGYSERLKTYKVYNSKTNTVEELIHVKFDEKEHDNKMSKLVESSVEFQITEEASTPKQAFEALELVIVRNGPKWCNL